MLTLAIRQASKSDASTLASIGYAAWDRGIGHGLPKATRQQVTAQHFETFANAQPSNILLAETEDGPVGYIAAADGENTVTDLWVHADHEGQGIGSLLLKDLEILLKHRGFETAFLEIMTSDTRLLGLSRNRGYKRVSRGMRVDHILKLPLHKTQLSKRLIGGKG